MEIGWLAELGINETIVPLPPGIIGLAEYHDRLAWVASDIMPHIN